MYKGSRSKYMPVTPRYCDSTFTITFAIEILGVDVWHDCNEGWLDLGACIQGMKIQYQLYPGQCFELDILIWPHVAKIWCGSEHCFVRTWQLLERRWLAFTIRHVFPVRVLDMINHVATITPCVGIGALSANAKNDKNIEAYLPPLKFAELRYFGRVLDKVESLEQYIRDFIWKQIESHIPSSYLDGPFNAPQCVTDVRHQNKILKLVRDSILKKASNLNNEEMVTKSEASVKSDGKKIRSVKKSATTKLKTTNKKKVVKTTKQKLELKLSGNTILAGIGQIVPFESIGDRSSDLGEIISVISSNNLPAQDDLPIIFVIVENLMDIPVEDLKKLRIVHLYVKWKLGKEQRFSKKQHLQSANNVNFNDFNSIPLSFEVTSEIASIFLDNPFEIQLRGIINSDINKESSALNNEEDVFIAVTKIDASQLSKGPNAIIKGEYSLYPFDASVNNLERKNICTDESNVIKLEEPQNVVAPSIILDAHMSLEVTIGIVGCKPRHLTTSYLRLFCLVSDLETIKGLMMKVTEINKNIPLNDQKNDFLTGFAIDAGDMTIAFVEGRSDGFILEVLKFTEDYYTKIKELFSLVDKYSNRIYPEMLSTSTPFIILKMLAPLNSLLACPAVYVKPALPAPAKAALLKIGRLISSDLKLIPNRSYMPTFEELSSFKFELCESSSTQ